METGFTDTLDALRDAVELVREKAAAPAVWHHIPFSCLITDSLDGLPSGPINERSVRAIKNAAAQTKQKQGNVFHEVSSPGDDSDPQAVVLYYIPPASSRLTRHVTNEPATTPAGLLLGAIRHALDTRSASEFTFLLPASAFGDDTTAMQNILSQLDSVPHPPVLIVYGSGGSAGVPHRPVWQFLAPFLHVLDIVVAHARAPESPADIEGWAATTSDMTASAQAACRHILAPSPPYDVHFLADQDPTACEVDALLVVAGSRVDQRLQEAMPLYRTWRETESPDASGHHRWDTPLEHGHLVAYPLFPRAIVLVHAHRSMRNDIAAAFDDVHTRSRQDLAVFLPDDAQHNSVVQAVVDVIQRGAQPRETRKKSHVFWSRAGSPSSSSPRAPTPPQQRATLLARPAPRIFLCSLASCAPWSDALGLDSVPFEDTVLQRLLHLVSVSYDVQLVITHELYTAQL